MVAFFLLDKCTFQMEKKQKQIVDKLRKADKQYCECCEKAEVARQEWDLAVSRVSIVMLY